MNTSRSLALALVVGVLAGTGGYFLGKGNRQPEPPASPPARNVSIPTGEPQPAAGVHVPSGLAGLLGNETINDSNAGGIMFRALEEAHPVRRMAAVGLLLASMTPGNARAIRQAFLDVTVKTGRRHDGEWSLMLRRYGEVLGAEGLKDLKPDMQNVALAVEGWAGVDPEGAGAAIREPGMESARLNNAWLTGLCSKDPQKALGLALDGFTPSLDTNALMTQAIHTMGLDGARDALQNVLNAAPAEAGASPEFQHLFDSLVDSMFHKHKTEGTTSEMCAWLEKQKDQPYLSESIVSHGVQDALQQGNPADAIGWLERINEGRTGPPIGSKGIYAAFVKDPNIVAGMDAATLARTLALMPPNPAAYNAIAEMVEPLNADRAKQLRAAAATQTPPP